MDSVQSVEAVELAGAAPEKEQGKEVRPRPQCLSETIFSLAGWCIWFLLSFVIIDVLKNRLPFWPFCVFFSGHTQECVLQTVFE